MKSIIASAAGLLSLTSTATAQTVRSQAFTLSLQSTNKTLNGKTLASFHEGAAIEGLGVGPFQASQYHLNTTAGQSDSKLGQTGVLTWLLTGGTGSITESEPMNFFYQPSTNVAHAQFTPSYQNTMVGFDKNDKMFIPSYYNDRVTLPQEGTAFALYHWYICDYDYEGYGYQTLNFVVGYDKPQNPSCQKVDVKRTFVKY